MKRRSHNLEVLRAYLNAVVTGLTCIVIWNASDLVALAKELIRLAMALVGARKFYCLAAEQLEKPVV